ncbi:MAG: hypothetical protein Ct9H300mP11_12560 [Chloroflexota bacterium]|nr:MAG: hypothetical protein Ct9H300mP11_12560 [Chloroflexota bacterium]
MDSEFDVTGVNELPRVDIAPAYAGADGLMSERWPTQGVYG